MTEIIQSENLDLLNALKEQMRAQELSALIIPHDDEYLSCNLTPDCERIATLTGFTGSAGWVCVSTLEEQDIPEFPLEITSLKDAQQILQIEHEQAVFVDGRYKVQVKEQVDTEVYDCFNLSEMNPAHWLCSFLPKDARVGIDLRCISYQYFLSLKETLAEEDIELVGLDESLIDIVWEDRPKPIISPIELFPEELSGCASQHKRKALAKALRNKGMDATIISNPETICWLLNIRGRDRQYMPVINCRLVAFANEALEWYINLDHLTDDVQSNLDDHLGHIDIFPEIAFSDVLDRLSSSNCSIYIDPQATNAWVLHRLHENGAKVFEGLGLCELPKARKNPAELGGEHKAHTKDGIAMCRFLAWLKNLTQVDHLNDLEAYERRVEDISEETIADKAEAFRKIEGDYIEPSFATISALGPNAAMCHYNHAEVHTPRVLGQDPMYLIDSGAHYASGTTDITRTVLVGPNLTERMQEMYTTVLKAHIALASTIFPPGTTGLQLDAIARRPLWEIGCDYEHGTGHGVGHRLAVHEGPQNISSHSSLVPLEPGMIVSIEPGYYEDGEFGIRLENLVEVVQCSQQGRQHMLCFKPLTLVPFDNALIIREMLSPAERSWLNDYHQNVLSIIQASATTLSDMEVNYLTEATAPL